MKKIVLLFVVFSLMHCMASFGQATRSRNTSESYAPATALTAADVAKLLMEKKHLTSHTSGNVPNSQAASRGVLASCHALIFEEHFGGPVTAGASNWPAVNLAGWSVAQAAGTATWGVANTTATSDMTTASFPGYTGAVTGANGFAYFSDDNAGNGADNVASLITPTIDASCGGNLQLDFNWGFRSNAIATETFTAYISTNNGAAWTVLQAIPTATTSKGHYTIDITAYSSATMKLRFEYNDGTGSNWNWAAAIDDVEIRADNASCAPANDCICNAISLNQGANTGFSNKGADTQPGEPVPSNFNIATGGDTYTDNFKLWRTVWFKYKPTSGGGGGNGTYRFDVSGVSGTASGNFYKSSPGTNFDPTFCIFRDTRANCPSTCPAFSDLAQVTVNGLDAGDGSTVIDETYTSACLDATQTYYIMVGGASYFGSGTAVGYGYTLSTYSTNFGIAITALGTPPPALISDVCGTTNNIAVNATQTNTYCNSMYTPASTDPQPVAGGLACAMGTSPTNTVLNNPCRHTSYYPITNPNAAAVNYSVCVTGTAPNIAILDACPTATTAAAIVCTSGANLACTTVTIPPGSTYYIYIESTGSVTVTINNVVLPIEMLEFKGEAMDGKNYLYWATSSEKENSHFEVERSENGILFYSIGEVQGSNNSNTFQRYNFIDENSVSLMSYYRLKQVDTDGNFNHTKIVSVKQSNKDFKIYDALPNPTSDNVTIRIENPAMDGEVSTLVTDVTGRIVASQIHLLTQGRNMLDCNLSNFVAGTYYLYVRSSTVNKIMKIIKR